MKVQEERRVASVQAKITKHDGGRDDDEDDDFKFQSRSPVCQIAAVTFDAVQAHTSIACNKFGHML